MDTPPPALTCVDWSADHLDGLVVVALLRSEGIEAFLPDENLVRQDWFYILAYGGFRILVPSADAARARELLAAFRSGELALDESEVEVPQCPHCAHRASTIDPRPRRWAFGFILVARLVFAPLFLLTLFPNLLRRFVQRRHRCPACGAAWQSPPLPSFSRLQQDAQT